MRRSSSSSRLSTTGDNLTAFQIDSLPDDLVLPALPGIKDKQLYNIVTSHASLFSSAKKTMDLDPKVMVLDYEKLEHVGDSLLGAMVTVLLHDLFPLLGEGPATTLKGSLVSNATLAKISEAYGIPQHLRAPTATLRVTRKQVRTESSMFEAWIAGVFYSSFGDLEDAIKEIEGEESAAAAEEVVMEEEQGQSVNAAAETASDASATQPAIVKVDNGQETPRDAHPPMTYACKVSFPTPAQMTFGSVQPTSHQGTVAPAVSSITTSSVASSIHAANDPSESKGPPTTANCSDHPSAPDAPLELVDKISTASHPSPSYLRYRWLAMAILDDWLRPLFTPIAHYALAKLKEEQIRLDLLPPGSSNKMLLSPEVAAENALAEGAVSFLEMFKMEDKSKVRVVKYDFSQKDTDWTAVCAFQEDDAAVVTGQGVRTNQKTAKALAAYAVCQKLDIWK